MNFPTQAYINGQWKNASDGAVFAVHNPATGKEIARVPRLTAHDIISAIDAAHTAFESWKTLTAKERSQILRSWFENIIANTEPLAQTLTAEQGKPIKEARSEIAYAASFIEWFAEEAKRTYGQTIPSPWKESNLFTQLSPVGVCGMITPWNFPAAMITRKVGAALAAGCTAMVKPASQTPLTALHLAKLAEEASLPAGVLNILTGDAASITSVWMSDERVRKISFTGSTNVGKILMQQSAENLKRLSLELGGNAPFIICEDADIDAALNGLMASKFRNSGQTCICANRIFIDHKIEKQFIEKLIQKMRSELIVGDGTEEHVTQGPLISEEACQKVEGLLKDATQKDARIIEGGTRHALGGSFFTPTIVTNVSPEMQLFHEEIFGPVVSIITTQNDDHALELANHTPYGLASYCYTSSLTRARFYIDGLKCGMVAINSGSLSTEVAPFGGINQSGMGREGGSVGVGEYMDVKYVRVG